MFKYIFILLPFMLWAESSMKCETGKCSTGKEVKSKIVKTEKKPDKKTNIKTSIEQLFNVRTIEVKEMISAKKQINYGYIVAQDALKIDVVAWFSGFITTLYAKNLYTKVEKGDALAQVYSPEVYKAKQDYLHSIHFNTTRSAPAMLNSAKTKLAFLGVSTKEIAHIEKELKANEYTTIYAPVSGWIFEKNINQGSSFDMKKKLFQIVNLKKVWLEAKLFQNEIVSLENMKDFKVNIKGIAQSFTARKSLLYPMLNPKESTATLRLEIDNNSGILKPGMYAKLHSSANEQKRLVIPRTAVIRKNGIWYAFLATDFKGEYEPIIIEIKPLNNKEYEVIKGLNLGDTLVNNALFMMDSDAQINSIY
ncbi:MAG: efflux RND transporter periplasmic adaptor subunit [Epsilonproteobacteria bacterium]|nr:MAG: efflux RND transporter periplasmic adaptor subunit [Campylobacterota bacterium]